MSVEHLLVDALGGAAQRQFAQRGQIAGREEMLERALGLLRDVDLALLQPLDQVVGREVDELDVVGAIEDRVRHRLAHADAGDLRDDVVQAFDVLDVERGVDVDAAAQQLLDIQIALGVPAARRIGVRELVDEDELRAAREDGVEVHLVEHAGRCSRLRRRGTTSRPSSSASVSVRPCVSTTPTTTSTPSLRSGPGLLQHLVGLADARRGAEKDLQPPAALLASRRLQAGRRAMGADLGSRR